MSETPNGLQVGEIQFRGKPSKAFDRFKADLNGYDIDVPERNLGLVLGDPQCRQLIGNDGSATFAVHSTSTEKATQILRSGLTLPGMRNIGLGMDRKINPSQPMPSGTLVLLAGPKEKDQARINTSAMAYEYHGGLAKVVFAFPFPNNGKSDYIGSTINKSFLGTADGEFVQFVQEPEDSVNDSFLVNPAYAYGYFDLETQQFVPNEQFNGFEINKPPQDKSWLRRRLG